MHAGVDNTSRKKWDRAEYAARASAREANEVAPKANERAGTKAMIGGLMRGDLTRGNMIARDFEKDIASRIGTKAIVNAQTGDGLGFRCRESGAVLRDSAAYLDHINGKKQMKARGLSMRVERSTVEQVKAKFDEVKKRKADEAKSGGVEDYGKRLAIAETDDETAKERKKAKEKARKEAKRKADEEAMASLNGMDPEMAAMMGFSGFGGGK